MRVLMINVVCGIRSTGRICTDLATALEAQGHEVKIAYGRENVPEQFQKYAVRIGSDFDVKLHGVRARLLDGAGFGSKQATVKFIKWIKKYDPDVIHLHNIHGYYINVEVLFKYLRTSGKRIIWTLHDCWAFTGHSAYCDAVQCQKWKSGCSKCPQIKEYPKALLDRSEQNWIKKNRTFVGISNMTIVTPSHWLAGLVKESFLKEYPVEVIHNGIDTGQFKPLENDFRQFHGLQDKFIVLGVATSWDDMKGYSDFIRLSDMLDDTYRVILVGLTEDQIKKLPNNIIGIKETASVKELSYIYSAADVFLNLSYCENYPTANLEARAYGIPVITYKAGESIESVGSVSIAVEQGDLHGIVSAMNRVRSVLTDTTVDLDNQVIFDKYLNSYDEIQRGYWSVKSKYNLIGKSIVLGVAAIWDKRKGLNDFVRLSSELGDIYKIVLVGVTDEQIEKLPNLILGINQTNSISELVELYSIADVFVNPTYEDNYPTTNLEAVSCGTPVITYKTGGSPESANIFGNTVPKGNIDAIIAAITNIEKKCTPKRKNELSNTVTVKQYLTLF